MSVDEETQKKIGQLQLLEQNLQTFLMQKQGFQSQLIEIESALEEIEKTDTTYKIIGNIMVSVNKDDLKKELAEKKEMLDMKIKTVEKQEGKIKETAAKTQEEVMEKMK